MIKFSVEAESIPVQFKKINILNKDKEKNIVPKIKLIKIPDYECARYKVKNYHRKISKTYK